MESSVVIRPWGHLRLIAADIKLAHSVFAMPFALLAAVMAAMPYMAEAADGRRLAGQLALIVLAMFFARTCAMLSNRILDREIDARNPRTASRVIPSGQLPLGRAAYALAACAALFAVTCAGFGVFHENWWPLILAAPVLAWICAYPYLKRFTALCHLYLGASLALSPIAAAIAIEPESISPMSPLFQPAILLLSGMVLGWVAGFDIIYALQDVEIDRAEKLHSIPSQLGIERGLVIARLLHAFALVALATALVVDDRFQYLFGAGVMIVAVLLVYEHATVSRWGTTRIALTFFTLNGLISCVVGALGMADVLI